ncbi:hypothetical protein AMEX_G563 [Astyanax mexicanus]|uniref:C-type lectin domain-containing protein n=1 Tax=Astyanax mexicanus TaxID=7994 RepID=A0A8T2MF39_ASTMX|nr:hypothetical protein AMEX_G563 [Astyanax mexicanus]
MAMEMQQRSFNIFEEGGQREEGLSYRTEDTYQCLQNPPTALPKTEQPASDKYGIRKMVLLPFIIIIILLTAILCIVGAHYHHFRQTRVELGSDQNTNREAWFLNGNSFYLFWTRHGDCDTAVQFCEKRGATLAVVEENNMDWLKSETKGKHFLVRTNQFESSGDTYMDEEISECEFIDATSIPDVNNVEGWVCERAVN